MFLSKLSLNSNFINDFEILFDNIENNKVLMNIITISNNSFTYRNASIISEQLKQKFQNKNNNSNNLKIIYTELLRSNFL